MIHDRDPGNAENLANILKSIPAPDATASELRDRLSEILTKMVTDLNSSGKDAPRRSGPLPKQLTDEYDSWRKDYDQWLKSAAPKRQTNP